MFEREKPITNLSLTFLSVANQFDIIVVWKSHADISLNKMWLTLHVLSLIEHLFAVESKICPTESCWASCFFNSFGSAHLSI